MSVSLAAASWSLADISLAVEALAEAAGFPVRRSTPTVQGAEIEQIAQALGLEAEPVRVTGTNCRTVFGEGVPGILQYAGTALAVVQAQGDNLAAISPDRRVRTLSLSDVEGVLLSPFDDRVPELTEMLEAAGISPKRRDESRRALLREYVAAETVALFWELRVPCGGPFRTQMSKAGLRRSLAVAGTAHLLEYAIWVTSWTLLGRSVLVGRLDGSMLYGWMLLLATVVPLRMLSRWAQGRAGIGISGLMKQRLMAGACRVRPEIIRSDGPGGLLGRVLESEVIENVAVNAGFGSAFGVAELFLSGLILGLVPGAAGALVALVGYTVVGAATAWAYGRRRSSWTARRIEITKDLIERMSGYRTVIAQLPREYWHEAEDPPLSEYAQESRYLDRYRNLLIAAIPSGWMVVGCACLMPIFLSGNSAASLAAALGGVLLARTALTRITRGVADVAAVWLAVKAVRPIFDAAADNGEAAPRFIGHCPEFSSLEARDVRVTYAKPVLCGASTLITAGEHVIVSGAPAAGRTTLGAVLAGLTSTEAGLVLISGLDQAALGQREWRRRIALAPQWRDNHVFTGTFAFNLLIAGQLPPDEKDLAQARSVCTALGLDALLQRMPAGLQQMVGDSGWQLSEGEKARLYLGRCLMQNADVLVLDDPLTALDVRTRAQILRFLSTRSETLILLTS